MKIKHKCGKCTDEADWHIEKAMMYIDRAKQHTIKTKWLIEKCRCEE